jgi:hypothetical protein
VGVGAGEDLVGVAVFGLDSDRRAGDCSDGTADATSGAHTGALASAKAASWRSLLGRRRESKAAEQQDGQDQAFQHDWLSLANDVERCTFARIDGNAGGEDADGGRGRRAEGPTTCTCRAGSAGVSLQHRVDSRHA